MSTATIKYSLRDVRIVTVLLFYCSTFMFNSGGNGIVNIGYAPVKFSGQNVFIGNNGAALRVSQLVSVSVFTTYYILLTDYWELS